MGTPCISDLISWDLPIFLQSLVKSLSIFFITNNLELKKLGSGVPVVAQWLTNPTRNREVAGSVPALAQWVNDPALQ